MRRRMFGLWRTYAQSGDPAFRATTLIELVAKLEDDPYPLPELGDLIVLPVRLDRRGKVVSLGGLSKAERRELEQLYERARVRYRERNRLLLETLHGGRRPRSRRRRR